LTNKVFEILNKLYLEPSISGIFFTIKQPVATGWNWHKPICHLSEPNHHLPQSVTKHINIPHKKAKWSLTWL